MARLLSYVLEEVLQRGGAADDQPPAPVVQQVQKLHEAAHLVEMAMDEAFLRCFNREKCHENHEKKEKMLQTGDHFDLFFVKNGVFTGEKCWDFIMKN